MRTAVLKLFILIVIIVGSLQSIGFLFGLEHLRYIGFLSQASPLPLVLNPVGGRESLFYHYEIQFVFTDQSRKRIKVTPELLQRFKRTHKLRLIYTLPFFMSHIYPREIWEPPLYYGFCQPAEVAGFLGIDQPIDYMRLYLIPPRSDGSITILTTTCES